MILSDKTNRSNRRWLQMCVVLLCAMFVLPLGMASAQDYEAVGKRLRAAVAAGELTGEQARAMLGALRRAGGARKEQDPDQQPDRAREYLMQVRKELGAAVEAGRISREEATRRYEAAEKGIRERMAAGGRGDSKRITRADLERAAIKIRKAVAEGKISEEDGRARLQGMRKMMADRSGDRRAEYEAFERRIRAAVEAGEMTREDAREQLAGYRRRLATAERGGERDDGMVRRIAGALSDAGIEREKIRDVMGAMRRIVAEVQSEGERFELDPRMSAHLKELGLTGDQIGLVVGLARRLANRAAD